MAVRHGHTFGVRAGATGQAVVSASCDAAPAPTDRPRGGGCDAQRGDTACSRALPVLRFRQAQRGKAAAAAAPGATVGALPAGSAPRLGASAALRGDTLLSQQSGTQACTAALGAGWRMACANDSNAWSDRAGRHASLASASGRYWVATKEPAGNCWDAPPAAEAARASVSPAAPTAADTAALMVELSKLRSTPKFARLSAPCRASFDTVERGLRANADGGPSQAALTPLVAWLKQCGKEAAAPAR
jgi:hypothetical protein